MDEFCGSEFWNSSVTWNTTNPDLTECFQKTVLVWTPCAFLWTFTLVEVSYILNSKDRNIPWNFLSISKLFLTCVLIVLTVVDLGVAVHNSSSSMEVADVEYYTPVIKILTFCLSTILLYYNRRYGLRTSGLLFLFWFVLTMCSIPQFRSEIMKESKRPEEEKAMYPFITCMIYFPLIVLMLFLNCFADLRPTESPYPQTEKSCPERRCSFLSKLLYSWFDSMAWIGYKKPLEDSDLWDMNPEDCSKEVVPKFERHWQKSLEKSGGISTSSTRASFSKATASVDIGSSKKKTSASILPAIFKTFGPTFLFGAFLKLIQDLLTFVSPKLLSVLIDFVDSEQENWKGYFYASLLFGTAVLQTLLLSQYFHRMFLVGLRIRTALISTIYKKSLTLSNSARKESTVGEIVNLMSVDAQRFMDLTSYLNLIWSAPLQIVLALFFLWQILGPSVLAGLAVMIFLIPINGFIANKIKTLQIRQMKNKDERVKLMNEVLSGIKVLKLYAWEPSYEEQVLRIRNKEIKVLRDQAYLNAATSFIWSCAPFLVSLLTLGTYVLVDKDNELTPQRAFVTLHLFNIMYMPLNLLPILLVFVVEVSLVTFATFVLSDPENNILDSKIAFVSLSLFNILRFPLSMLPMLISSIVQTSVSVKRINKFLNAEELDPESTLHEPESDPLIIENGTFSWGKNESVLHNINVNISKGSLVAVVGSVGSGKSSLLSAFLGEMDKLSGRVNSQGSIAYVSQQAWIQNCTLRDNILFGKELNRSTYNRIVEACALKPDLDMLPGGDQTEIGEKGINLSGGQKQRVSLARSVYYDSDIYLLDDPLSAVDSHVGKHIFDQVIGPAGVLKNKTRVLVTHGITFLPQVDKIIVLKDGEVSESGTYQQLLAKKGAFADFLLQHLNDGEEQIESAILEIKKQLESSLGEKEFLTKLQRARSLSESPSETNSVEIRPSIERSISQVKKTPEKTPDKIIEKKDKLIEAEKVVTGSVKWSIFSHYLRSIGLFLATSTVLMNMTYQAFSIGSNYWLAIWSSDENYVVNGTVDFAKRDMYLGVYGGMGLAQVITISASMLTLFLGALDASKLLHELMLSNVLRAPSTSFFDVTPVGRILNRFGKDIDVLDNILPMTIRGWVTCFFSVVGTLSVISINTPIFVAVIIPVGILYYFIQRFYVATSRQLKRLESISRSPIYSHFGETVQGASVIRAYGVQDRFINESDSKVDYNQLSYYPSIIANRWLAVRLEMMSNLIILFAAVFAVISRDTIPASLVGLSVTYALQITQTLNWLVRMTSEVETNIVAVERIREYAETPREAPWNINETAPNKEWPATGHIKIEKLVMKYRTNTEPVLHGISCEVKPGEKVGIVGRTGAGKSTLTLALFRIVEPHSGKIFIDNLDISTLGLHSLRSRITIIPQDPVLFSGSLRSNLDPFESFSDDEVWRALEHAHLKTFVKGLAAGLNHVISEGGENLSVGQRQLICLARALLRKTQLLILDEATAAVDLETDDLIQRTIRTEFASCTVLTIAHRLNTIMDSNRVLVLDKGYLAEYDSPATLLQDKKSIFYGMAKDAGIVN